MCRQSRPRHLQLMVCLVRHEMRFIVIICVALMLFVTGGMFSVVRICRAQCEEEKQINEIDNKLEYQFDLKKILMFSYLSNTHRFLTMGRTGFIEADCPVSNCYITLNQSAAAEDEFDSIIFQGWQFNETWRKRKRKPHQMYIFYSSEPPGLNGMAHDLDQYNGFFNRTMTYLSDSDFHYPFGRIDALPSAPKSTVERLRMMRNVFRSDYNPAAGKNNIAVIMTMNCDVPSQRLNYVHQLQKHISVDIISPGGKCGGEDACPLWTHYRNYEDECRDMIEIKYKFYLAFENSICDEYVTEKFFFAIGRNIVPVVLGGANYSAIAPPHSYINALDYTPKELAEYLTLLHLNDHLYAEYFWWKPHYQVFNSISLASNVFCDICEALHRPKRKVVTGLQNWFVNSRHCVSRPFYAD